MQFIEAEQPTHIKWGFFGKPGSGKTFTAAKVLSQFVAKYAPDSQIAMLDTENGSGHIKNLVKKITGKPLMVPSVVGTIGETFEFLDECKKRGWAAIIDSVTQPWARLSNDRLLWRKARIQAAHGNPDTAKMQIDDWMYVKSVWKPLTYRFVHDPVHILLLGREGIEWGIILDDEGNAKQGQTGIKMKTENEMGHEPNLLIQMRARQLDPTGKTNVNMVHEAVVWKDRSDTANMTGKIGANPDLAFFMPHIETLNLGGVRTEPGESEPTFANGGGPTWETIKARREAVLEKIKDDITEVMPGQTVAEKKSKVTVLRQAFGDTSWAELEKDHHKWPVEALEDGRAKLRVILKEIQSGKESK